MKLKSAVPLYVHVWLFEAAFVPFWCMLSFFLVFNSSIDTLCYVVKSVHASTTCYHSLTIVSILVCVYIQYMQYIQYIQYMQYIQYVHAVRTGHAVQIIEKVTVTKHL